MSERELLNELREIVRVGHDWDASDWRRGYEALAELVDRWAAQRAQLDRSIDYRALLIKYVLHVADEEGTTFLVNDKRPADRFTDIEWAELGAIADGLPEPKPLVIT